jgi:FkbM family methyltransferase
MSTAAKVRLARILYRALIAIRSIRGLPEVFVANRRGVVYEIDPADAIDLATYLGVYERDTYLALARLVRSGDVVLDIGANSGVHTLPLARMVGDAGRVVAFEPTNFAFARLRHNLQLNPAIAGRVTPVLAYLSDGQHGRPSGFYARWRLDEVGDQHPLHKGSLEEANNAEAWTLDGYVAVAGIDRVAVIKLDVDGFECDVLRGATELLRRDRPAIVTELCPYALEEHGASVQQLIGVLSDHGYSIHDERTLARKFKPASVAASIRHNSSINVVALSAPAVIGSVASRSPNAVRS